MVCAASWRFQYIFSHAAIYNRFLRGDGWHLPPSRFYAMLGQGGVAIFFMITGFLFWSRMINSCGRYNFIQLYIGRVFRIGPVYVFAVMIMMCVVFTRSGFQIEEAYIKLGKEIIRWLLFGFYQSDLNGDRNASLILAYVTWTLHFEWLFYFSLPITAFAARYDWTHLPFSLIGLSLSLFLSVYMDLRDAIYASLFFAGMASASLHKKSLRPKLRNEIDSCLVVAFLVAAFALFPTAYCVGAVIMLGIAFYLIASGCTVFGVLEARATRRLGDVSYGIYLLQGVVLTFMFSWSPVRELALSSPVGHWAATFAGAAVLVVFAMTVHVVIERPGIDFGRHLTILLRRAIVDQSIEAVDGAQ